MATVGFVVHRSRRQATELARDAIAFLEEEGHRARVPHDDAAACGLADWSWPAQELGRGLDLAVSLGGDGTMLRTVDLVGPFGVPVLGVNVGHLGYLTQCDPTDLRSALKRVFAGDFSVEERMTLHVEAGPGGEPLAPLTALNEAWLEKTLPGHTIRVLVHIGENPFISYAADGLILATPTGSTAYNLSVRGPILSPTLRALIMTPVAPHQLFDLSMVLEATDVVRLEVLEGRSATLLVDGRRICELAPGESVTCRAGPHPARLVTFGPRDFYRILKAKFGLTDR